MNGTSREWTCAQCGVRSCEAPPGTRAAPPGCPMTACAQELEQAGRTYGENDAVRRLALAAARTEAAGYCRSTRIEEIMDFARRLGASRIGIAHCVGLMREAGAAAEIFTRNGFRVHTVCCKAGSLDKERLGLTDAEKVRPGQYEAACNPVGQAALLAAAGTQLNVVIGLCVGHDSVFFMHSQAPVTVLVAKDRVLGHNPAAALYTSHSYYRRLKQPAGAAHEGKGKR